MSLVVPLISRLFGPIGQTRAAGATLGGLWAFGGACGRAGRGEGREEKMAAGGQKGPRKTERGSEIESTFLSEANLTEYFFRLLSGRRKESRLQNIPLSFLPAILSYCTEGEGASCC